MNNKLRLLVVEDEPFTRQLVANALEQQGFEVQECADASTAIDLIGVFEPHVVISDLDLGSSGASGIDLLQHVERLHPWIGLVALTAHSNPKLAASGQLPASVAYLIKSEITELDQLGSAIRATLSRTQPDFVAQANEGQDAELYFVSRDQAEALRMLAQGMTNKVIAETRGTSIRAVENLISRTYAALQLDRDTSRNYRIEAVKLWQTGRVRVE
ncbi:MAG: response regulator transcription factor [Actinomycetales bacterium]|nr:response regulator transcription factor [Actinomycetales bacterium]